MSDTDTSTSAPSGGPEIGCDGHVAGKPGGVGKVVPPVPPPPPSLGEGLARRAKLRATRAQSRWLADAETSSTARPMPTTSLRWKGELDEVGASSSGEDETREDSFEKVSRTAPPWLISLLIHLTLLLVLALISTPAVGKLGGVVLELGQGESEVADLQMAEFEISTEEIAEMSESIEESPAVVEVPSVFELMKTTELSEVAPADLGADALADLGSPMFSGRTGAMKAALLAKFGGTPETQAAVERGLAWLKRNQKRNGSWSMRGPYTDGGYAENETAATAMALLAFAGDGHTHKSGKYADDVMKGLKFLVGQQDRFGFMARKARHHERMYAQAQATIVLCELYAMTNDSWLREKAQRALDFAQDSQGRLGGWRYETQPGGDSDTSVTGWFVMALQSGLAGGLDVDPSIFAKIDAYLDLVSEFDGAAYGYQPRQTPSPAMTAEGLLCRQYLGWERQRPTLRRGIDALLIDAPFTLKDRDVYYWYYATQVMHHYGGGPWSEWNSVMRSELPAAQVIGGREDGSWAPQSDAWGSDVGRLYTTCLSLYCLEVYYRHLPLYSKRDDWKAEP